MIRNIEDFKTLPNFISGEAMVSVFDEVYSDILTYKFKSEHQFMIEMWTRYLNISHSKHLDFRIFQALLLILFYKRNILPIYTKASFHNLPNNNFDFVAYTENFGPLVVSTKVKLRSRYKQPDLKGMLLRQTHRTAKNYLITLDGKETKTLNKKIESNQVLGIDRVIVATSPEFDSFIESLMPYTYIKAPKVNTFTYQYSTPSSPRRRGR